MTPRVTFLIESNLRKGTLVTHILVVDDHAVVRQGVRQILSEQFRDATIGEAASAQEMMEQLRLHNWDVVVLDVGMPGKAGSMPSRSSSKPRPSFPSSC